jgi:5,10-methylene-tetrahydrofolate dehydrogenase/methenyl tetrahydrofolate cyclohydrolase
MAQLIDGKAIAARIRADVATDVAAFTAQTGYIPTLATVLVGDDAGSAYYVRAKHRACKQAGIESVGHELSAETTQAELETLINALNNDKNIDGILVQLPLPAHLNEQRIIDLVAIEKDVDGFNVQNMGALAMRGREPRFVPATPLGVMRLLAETGVDLSGKNVVMIGRSNLVGTPTTLLLANANATVTLCHSRTRNLADHTRNADIVIAAVGRPNLVSGDMLKPGCTVIDVAINEVPDQSAKRGYRLVGDVDFESAEKVAAHITPVPGGVGPMTIAMLLTNTLKAATLRQQSI